MTKRGVCFGAVLEARARQPKAKTPTSEAFTEILRQREVNLLFRVASSALATGAAPEVTAAKRDGLLSTVVVCALTTNVAKAKEPGNVLLDPGEGGLPKQSAVVVSQISSVEKTRLGERIGALSEARVEEILAGLRFLQRSFFTR